MDELNKKVLNNELDNVSYPKEGENDTIQEQLSFEPASISSEDVLDDSFENENSISNQSNISIKKILLPVCIITFIISSLTTILFMHLYSKYVYVSNTSTIVASNEKIENTNLYKAISDKASPSVVGITTKSIDTNNLFSIPQESSGVGTGIIVDANGYILTNSHVVNDGQSTEISVVLNDGQSVHGKVLWNDALMDLAVIKVEKNNLPTAELGDSDKIAVGDIAVAIGNPIGLDFQKSVTQGIISGLDRTIEDVNMSMSGLIQTDASINPGNSGGPLLNSQGNVIGITTAKVSNSEGIGFAIPINVVKTILDQVIKTGTFEKVKLGIKGVTLESFESLMNVDLQADSGIYILEVEPNSVASYSGLATGDVILEINNVQINSMTDLNKELYKYSFGDKVDVKINKNGEEKLVSINFTK